MKIQAETIRLSDRSWSKAQVLLSVETEETQLGSLEDQVSSYLYYTRYTERSTTSATWNTPIVRYESLRRRYESVRVMQTTSHTESVSDESLESDTSTSHYES